MGFFIIEKLKEVGIIRFYFIVNINRLINLFSYCNYDIIKIAILFFLYYIRKGGDYDGAIFTSRAKRFRSYKSEWQKKEEREKIKKRR